MLLAASLRAASIATRGAEGQGNLGRARQWLALENEHAWHSYPRAIPKKYPQLTHRGYHRERREDREEPCVTVLLGKTLSRALPAATSASRSTAMISSYRASMLRSVGTPQLT